MSNLKFKSSMNFSKKLGFCFVGQFLLSQEILAVRTLHAVHSFITSLLARKKVKSLQGARAIIPWHLPVHELLSEIKVISWHSGCQK